MGGKMSCMRFWVKENPDSNSPPVSPHSTFLLQSALVELPPSVSLNRIHPVIPQCLLTGPWFLALQDELPVHLQRRKLKLVYASWEHGFSFTALKLAVGEHNSHRVNTQDLLLIIRPSLALKDTSRTDEGDDDTVDSAPLAIIGAFLPSGIDFSARKYYGTDGTFVFTSMVAAPSTYGAPSESPSHHSKTKSYGNTSSASGHTAGAPSPGLASPSSPVAASPLTIFRCSEPKANDYFVRTSDGVVSIGGGGKGAAISFDQEMDYVLSSVDCPTFGNGCRSLLPADGGESLGVVREGMQAKAPMHTIELWAFSDITFMTETPQMA